MATATYDSKCYDLAEAFLEDWQHLNNERRRHELATAIQRMIEDWISYEDSTTTKTSQ